MMLQAWWNVTMDARRSISLVLAAVGFAVSAIGIAASPMSLAFGINYGGAVGAVLGAAIGGYLRHRVSNGERALLWAFAYGASVAAFLAAWFGTAVVIRPAVGGIPGLGAAWSAIVMGGFLGMFVGAYLWERDAQRRRFGAMALVAVWLIVGGAFATGGGDPWGVLALPVFLGGIGLLLIAFLVRRPSSDQDSAHVAGGWH
jgi:hypothetical protein